MCAVGGDRKNGKKGEKELQWKRRLGKLNDLNMIAKGRQRPLLAIYICLACLPCAINFAIFRHQPSAKSEIFTSRKVSI